MSWSLSEIESLSRKAARGAGMSWGMAEEAGKSATWLAAADLPGPEALADLLERLHDQDLAEFAPVICADAWRAPGGALCPIRAGAALSDLGCSGETRIEGVIQPLLLLPFVVQAAEAPLVIHWPGATFACGDALRGAATALCGQADVLIEVATAPEQPMMECALRYSPHAEAVAVLERFAQLTYAPETEASRVSGAGAGLSDND
ncbi:DUF3726 domain-containing protein [Roseovarius sp. LXJ103]|uniref:DUF3726 domain-containing protein n=1 Tax=Roseovarius carneus TaxID=2853164 RepID=UPI000D603DB4|nr:DUF3726 domain-containing protein [Roseovarius carneus]MBZ8118694.1 DUF3726 domain-containing protein [Roseovarius carneus]PWE35625.1 DUF3726 domain-containing protein [Pelagicola sp. LXJ1103]